MAIASCCAVVAAGAAAAALPLYGTADAGGAVAEEGPHALALGGVATIVHQDADGNVLAEQAVHNQLLDAGEDFILQQVFMNGRSADDTAQIGAICLSAADPPAPPNKFNEATLNAATFHNSHVTAATGATVSGTSTISVDNAHECLTDTTVGNSSQVATVGPLVFTANNTDMSSNWKPEVAIKMIGICQGFSGANGKECTAPLFAAVDINEVTLGLDETLTVTYTFDMSSAGT